MHLNIGELLLRRSDPGGLVDIDLDVLQGSALQGQGQDDGAEACVQSERTAWAYVTAMHAAAVGGPRTPIRGIVEDVEDVRATLIQERNEARDRVARLERQLDRRKWWRQFWCATCQRAGVESARSALAAAWRLLAGAVRPLAGEKRDDGAAVQRLAATAGKPPETKAPAKARITLGELLMEQGLVSLEQCLEALRDHAVADPANQLAIDTVRSLTGWNVEPVVASASALHAPFDRYYGSPGSPGRAARDCLGKVLSCSIS